LCRNDACFRLQNFPAVAARIVRHIRLKSRHLDVAHAGLNSESMTGLISGASAGVVPLSAPELTPTRFVGEGTPVSAIAGKRQCVRRAAAGNP
jgi:hypothetical protein